MMECAIQPDPLRIDADNCTGSGRTHNESSSPSPKTISDFPQPQELPLPKFVIQPSSADTEHQLRPRESKADSESHSVSGVFKKKKSAWCRVGQRVIVKQTNARAVIISMSGAWINIRFDEQIKAGKPRGFRVSDLRRECGDGEEDDENDEVCGNNEDGEGVASAAAVQPMRRSSRRAAQTSSFGASDDEDEDDDTEFDDNNRMDMGRRVRRCTHSGMFTTKTNHYDEYAPYLRANSSSGPVPFFQTLDHLPVQGEEAGAGLLLESLAMMRELKRIRNEEASDRARDQEEENDAASSVPAAATTEKQTPVSETVEGAGNKEAATAALRTDAEGVQVTTQDDGSVIPVPDVPSNGNSGEITANLEPPTAEGVDSSSDIMGAEEAA